MKSNKAYVLIAILSFFIPAASVFAAAPVGLVNGGTFTANCDPGAVIVQLYGDVGSDFENTPFTGGNLTCGDTYTFNDSNPSSFYYWTEYSDIAATTIVLDTTFSLSNGTSSVLNFQYLIDSTANNFLNTTSFSLASLITWSGDNLIKVFIGSGLALLYELRYWIVALIIISAIVYFAYRAFRFFRH